MASLALYMPTYLSLPTWYSIYEKDPRLRTNEDLASVGHQQWSVFLKFRLFTYENYEDTYRIYQLKPLLWL